MAEGNLLVLDIDGVLIDPMGSFERAVALALADRCPGMAWSDAHFRAFKRLGGFNNDFRLTAGAIALHEAGRLDRLWDPGPHGLADFEPRMRELEPEAQRLVQAHYAETRRREQPTVTLTQLEELGVSLAILTGRPPEELELAWEVLGHTLPAICDSHASYRKPEPRGLLELAEAFQASRVIFVGDTTDDARCLRRARTMDAGRRWRFAGVGPDRAGFLEAGDLEAADLPALLPLLKSGGCWADTP